MLMTDQSNPLQDAIVALQRAEAAKLRELEEVRTALAALTGVSVVMPVREPEPTGPFKGMGALEAAKLWLKEAGKPQTTREIQDAIMERGWRTTSNRPSAVIYSTLTNASKMFERTEEGAWKLKGE